MELLVTQSRQILRRLARAPMFTAFTLLVLAGGIGAAAAMFSVVDCILLKPLPYPDPEQLIAIRYIGKTIHFNASQADYFIYREQSRSFQDVGIYRLGINAGGYAVDITGRGRPEHVPALGATDGVLSILGVTPLLGRTFTKADDQPGSSDTVILTYDYWMHRFGGDRSVIGQVLDVDGKAHTIIGVLRRGFTFLGRTNLAVLVPMRLDRATTYVGGYYFGGVARLKPGVTLTQANADVARMIPIVFQTFPPSPGTSINVFERLQLKPDLVPLKQEVVGDTGDVLWILMAGISLVLVVACANLANFLLVRAEGREQDLAIRAALGASRGHLASEFLLESVILAVLGGVIGLGIAYGALRVLMVMAPAGLPRLNEISINGSVVLFTLAMSLVASLCFGSVPVFKYARRGVENRMREGGRSMTESRERHRSRGLLATVQVALAFVLLVSSGLLFRTFRAMARIDPGFVPSQVQTLHVDFPDTKEKDPERVLGIEEEIFHKLEGIPSVSAVSISRNVPMDGSAWESGIYAKDRTYAPGEIPLGRWNFISPGFFKTQGTPLISGRDFNWSDIQNHLPVAIVSEKLARKYWGDPASALGKLIRTTPKDQWREVIGVAGDYHQDGVDKEVPISVYWPILMTHLGAEVDVYVSRQVDFVIRSRLAGSEGLMTDVRRAVWTVDPELPLSEVHTLTYYYDKSMARISFMLVMLAIAGCMALFLSVMGLYGTIAYSVLRRTHEIGIRMAIGANKSDVLRIFVGEGGRLALFGITVGLVGALVVTRFLSGLLYGVKSTDVLTLIAISLILFTVALIASYIPARRAAKLDPIAALRHE